MHVIVEIIEGPAAGKAVSIQPNQTCRVGRGDAADLVISDDRLLSRVHFIVECGPVSCRLRDLNSTNGTFVNGEKVAEAEVGRGDLVRAGNTSFAVRAVLEEATAQPLSEPAVPADAAPAGKNAGISTLLDMTSYVPPELKK